jgi:FtsH-binding integral membrane protein
MSFISLVYLHLFAGSALTFASSQYPASSSKAYYIGASIVSLILLLAMIGMKPGPLKYIVAALYCALLGQTIGPFFANLQQKDLVKPVLISVCGIFGAMTIAGFLDNQNILGFGGYLLAALLGLIVARVGTLFLSNSKESLTSANNVLSMIGTGLFSIFVAYDTQRLKEDAQQKKKHPDYIMATMELYLDLLNLFTNVGGLVDN